MFFLLNAKYNYILDIEIHISNQHILHTYILIVFPL